MGYMRESDLTKIENAAFLDLNRNKLSKKGFKTMDVDENMDQNEKENVAPKKTGKGSRNRKRKEADLDEICDDLDDLQFNEIKEPSKKRRKKNKKKKVKKVMKMFMKLFEDINKDSDDDY